MSEVLSVFFASLGILVAMANGQTPDTVLPRAFELPLIGSLGQSNHSLPLFMALAEGLSRNKNQPFGKLFNDLVPKMPELLESSVPKTTTSTTTTTTPSPIQQLGMNIENLGHTLVGGTKVFEAPLKIFNGLLAGTATLGKVGAATVDKTADKIAKATETTSKIATQMNRQEWDPRLEEESAYYEFTSADEPYTYRKPKYFSRECQFRIACEIGKTIKPLTYQITKVAETNRLIQDLQNRYTRAITYGTVHGNCERYFCLLVQIFGGPTGLASGVAEMVNRLVNPDMYEGYGYRR